MPWNEPSSGICVLLAEEPVSDLPQVERRVAPGRNHLRTATGAEDPAEG